MTRINLIKLKSLEKTKNFYLWELKRSKSLTESQRSKYLVALSSINKIIKEREEAEEKEKHKALFQNTRRGY